jgi:flagellar hook-associated protein 3 FlgL
MRISNNTIVETSLINIQTANDRFIKAQSTLAKGKTLNQPSDDPSGLSQALSIHTTLDNLDQYSRNLDDATGFVGLTDTALSQLSNQIRAARQLALQGANDALSTDERTALAEQTKQIAVEVAQIANSTYGSRFIFGGQRTTQPPFVPDNNGSFVYQGGTQGTQDANLTVAVAENENVVVNTSGDRVFDPVFQALAALQADLDNGQSSTISRVDVTAIDDALKSVTTIHAEFGASAQRLTQASDRLADKQAHLTTLLSKIEDADLPQTIMNLKSSEMAYQASLTATSRSFAVSLMDFLR